MTEFEEPIEVNLKKQLLLDFDIRWSAKLLMVDRVEELYPVRRFQGLKEPHPMLTHFVGYQSVLEDVERAASKPDLSQ